MTESNNNINAANKFQLIISPFPPVNYRVCRSWYELMKEKCLWIDVDLRCNHRLIPVSKLILFMRSYSLGSSLKRFKCNAADNRMLEHLQVGHILSNQSWNFHIFPEVQNCPSLRELRCNSFNLRCNF